MFDPLLGNRCTTDRCIRDPSHQSSLSVPRFRLLTGSQERKQGLFLPFRGFAINKHEGESSAAWGGSFPDVFHTARFPQSALRCHATKGNNPFEDVGHFDLAQID